MTLSDTFFVRVINEGRRWKGPVLRDDRLVSVYPEIRTRRRLQFHREGLVLETAGSPYRTETLGRIERQVFEMSVWHPNPRKSVHYGNLNFSENIFKDGCKTSAPPEIRTL